jgi:hypothetical protein
MIKRFKNFLTEGIKKDSLKYFALDWDDNILHMPTVIHMEKSIGNEWIPTDVSTAEFAKVRNDNENYRLINNDPVLAFSEFRDTGPRGENAFIEDVKNAIGAGDFAPAWDAFINCLSEGYIFAIITARGHEPQTIRRAIEFIIDNLLTEEQKTSMYANCLTHSYLFDRKEFDRIPKGQLSKTPLISEYLDNCDYYGVSSDSFASQFGSANASNPEKAKEMALEEFIKKCNNFGSRIGSQVKVGFSDDDPKNVEHVNKFFKEKSALSNDLKLSLYNTNDRTITGGVRTKYYESHDPLASSIMPFTQFNNMTNKLYPQGPHNRQDDNQNKINREVTQLAKTSKEIFKLKKGRRKSS